MKSLMRELRAPRICWQEEEGQSLIELALMVPIFTVLICYAVDFGYLFVTATSLNAAARNATEYAIQGSASPAQAAPPGAALVTSLTIASLGLPNASTSTVSVRVCSTSVGVNAVNNTALCSITSTGAGAISGSADVDPESPTFQVNRVDVVYTVNPPLPLPVSIFPSYSFRRYVEMRRMQ
jgi:Flp pilus assembly protein TadG